MKKTVLVLTLGLGLMAIPAMAEKACDCDSSYRSCAGQATIFQQYSAPQIGVMLQGLRDLTMMDVFEFLAAETPWYMIFW